MTGGAEDAPPYKVVEISDVVDREIEDALNRWTGAGYRFESIHFVTQPGSRRPAMAFLVFSRRAEPAAGGRPAGGAGEPRRAGRRG